MNFLKFVGIFGIVKTSELRCGGFGRFSSLLQRSPALSELFEAFSGFEKYNNLFSRRFMK